MAKEKQDAEQQDTQAQYKQCPMLKHQADFAEVALAKSPRNKDLYAHGKAHRQGGEDEVIQSSHHGGTQLDGAKVTQKSGVSKGDNGLRKVAQHNGVSDAPNLAVGDARCSHAAKLRNPRET